MKKLLLALVLVWLAALTIPAFGERVEPRVAPVREWIGDRLEGPMTPVRNRYRKAQVRSHLDKTQRALVMTRNQGGQPPEPDQLPRFMARHDVVPDGLDPWGTPYLLAQQGDSLAVISAGPDRTYYTDDDLAVRVRFPPRGSRRSPARR